MLVDILWQTAVRLIILLNTDSPFIIDPQIQYLLPLWALPCSLFWAGPVPEWHYCFGNDLCFLLVEKSSWSGQPSSVITAHSVLHVAIMPSTWVYSACVVCMVLLWVCTIFFFPSTFASCIYTVHSFKVWRVSYTSHWRHCPPTTWAYLRGSISIREFHALVASLDSMVLLTQHNYRGAACAYFMWLACTCIRSKCLH